MQESLLPESTASQLKEMSDHVELTEIEEQVTAACNRLKCEQQELMDTASSGTNDRPYSLPIPLNAQVLNNSSLQVGLLKCHIFGHETT